MDAIQSAELQVPLSEMIETLRSELQSSLKSSKGPISFDLDKIELELKVTVARKLKGEAGIAFWVVKAGAGTERSNDSIHTFKLTLSPVDSVTGNRVRVKHTELETPSRD
jgi:Trypsin-co-occurring domain 2